MATMLVATSTQMNTIAADQSLVEASTTQPPYINAKTLLHGIVTELNESSTEYKMADVYGCCSKSETCTAGDDDDDDDDDVNFQMEQRVIGSMAQMTKEQSLQVLNEAKQAWNNGSGTWPQMSLKERIQKIETFITELTKSREEIVTTLMWEIGKNRKDAEAEFDRTVQFVKESIAAIQNPNNGDFDSEFQEIGSTRAFVRRAAFGIIMCLGPYNYPLNETYATLIPALLMGNIVVMKIPTIGGLAHLISSKSDIRIYIC